MQELTKLVIYSFLWHTVQYYCVSGVVAGFWQHCGIQT